jgi:ribulose-phosphate 3-epimerase
MKNNSTIEIIPTCVPQSAAAVRENILKIKGFSSAIHLDIDDGVFTPEASWPFNEIPKKGSESREAGTLKRALDTSVVKTGDNFLIQVHLMVSDGRDVGENFIKAGARSIIIHVESAITPLAAFTDTLGAWSMIGVEEIGIGILLGTPLEKLDPLLPFCDFIHVLSVATIGAQGALFDPRAIDLVKEIRTRFPSHPISVDGGVSLDNIASLVKAGATRFCVGSAIAKGADAAQAYETLKTAAKDALQ